MALTRFKGRDGKDGPVAGALVIIPVDFGTVVTNVQVDKRIDLPVGMKFEVTDLQWSADAITSDPAIVVGDTAGGTQIAATVNLVTATASGQAITVKDGAVDAGGFIHARLTTDTGDAVTEGRLTIVGYVSGPPTSAVVRGTGHY